MFDFDDPVIRVKDLTYMPTDVVEVSIVYSPRGWRVCQHQTRIKPMESPAPITDFIQFSKSQPAYISQCYAKIVCKIPMIDIYKEIKETTKIIMAIYSGAVQYKGLIGFVLTTADGMILVSSYGQLAGHDPLLFRSEACAFLAATPIIFLIAEHYDELIVDAIGISCKIHLYTDSMSMIKKLNSMNTYPIVHLKYVMDSE